MTTAASAVEALDVPLVVGVTSHRNLAPDEIPAVRERVRDFFARLRRDYPGLPLVLLSPLAEGGDQLAAEEALAVGARLIAPLPLDAETYRADFVDADARARFDVLCGFADVLPLPLLRGNTVEGVGVPGEQRDRQYAQAGVFVASHCHLLLVLWDGRESDRLGGTAQVVRYALDGVMPGLVERRRMQATLTNADESVVHHIVCSRRDDDGTILPPAPGLAPLQTRWLAQKHVRDAAAGLPDEFRRLFSRMETYDRDLAIHPDAGAAGLAATGIPASAAADTLDRLFAATDALAIHYQKRVLRTLRAIHALAVLTGFVFIVYADLPGGAPLKQHLIHGFLGLFAAGGLLAWLAHRRDWHRKYIDYRALAEGLRVQRCWRRAGVVAAGASAFAYEGFLQKKDVELGWIRNVMRVASMDRIDAPADDGGIEAVVADWIGSADDGGQVGYYTRKTSDRGRTHRFTQRIGQACLWAGIAIVLFLALFQRDLAGGTADALVAAMAVLGVVAAARESYAYRKGDKELLRQYRYMLGVFSDAGARLKGAADAGERREILRALGEAALAEHSEWALMHRERPLENTRF